MNVQAPDALLFCFVVNLGIAYGAGLYEKRIVVPQWFRGSRRAGLQVNQEAMRQTNPGLRFWAYVTTVPLTLLTVASLAVATHSRGPRREWWLAAALITLAERLGTFGFFIPTAIKLMANGVHPTAAGVMASRWVLLNRFRDALTLTAWLAALVALTHSR